MGIIGFPDHHGNDLDYRVLISIIGFQSFELKIKYVQSLARFERLQEHVLHPCFPTTIEHSSGVFASKTIYRCNSVYKKQQRRRAESRVDESKETDNR